MRGLSSGTKLSSMHVSARGGVAESVLASVRPVVAAQRTLEDVVRWGLAQSPALLVCDVVVQDEYTHDVVVPWTDGKSFLVYDAT